MRNNKVIVPSLVLLFMMACSLFSTSTSKPTNTSTDNQGGNSEGSGGGGVNTTPTAGSADFSAQATSPQSIMLTWKAVDGATSYNLEYGWNGKDFHPLVDLPPSQTQRISQPYRAAWKITASRQ
jgi:hypothetical protein